MCRAGYGIRLYRFLVIAFLYILRYLYDSLNESETFVFVGNRDKNRGTTIRNLVDTDIRRTRSLLGTVTWCEVTLYPVESVTKRLLGCSRTRLLFLQQMLMGDV